MLLVLLFLAADVACKMIARLAPCITEGAFDSSGSGVDSKASAVQSLLPLGAESL